MAADVVVDSESLGIGRESCETRGNMRLGAGAGEANEDNSRISDRQCNGRGRMDESEATDESGRSGKYDPA